MPQKYIDGHGELIPRARSVVSDQPRRLDSDDLSMAEIWGLKIGLQLAYGNFEFAHELIELYRDESDHESEIPTADSPLIALELPVRTCNLIENELGVTTIGELAELSIEDLQRVPNMGQKQIADILSRLSKLASSRRPGRR